MKILGKEKRKSKMGYQLIFCFFLASLLGCVSTPEPKEVNTKQEGESLEVIYAEGFEIVQHDQFKRLTVKQSYKGNNQQFDYFLTNDSSFLPADFSGEVIITPIKTIAVLSATYIPFLRLLDQLESIVAVSGKNTIYDSVIYQSALNGEIKDLGEPELNVEQAIILNPDLIMGFAIDAQSMSQLGELKRFNQRVLINSEYMEPTPLAKAEWIKVFGALYDQDELAETIFQKIESDYLVLKRLAEKAADKPTVFTAVPWKGTWYVPGGNSFQAALLNDAGANYIWKENEESVSLPLDFEVVLARSIKSDYWLNVSTFRSLEEMKNSDERFTSFFAFKNKKVFNNTKTLTPYYGNDYWETGAARPDLILSDLIQIFHPELLKGKKFNYYEQLQ